MQKTSIKIQTMHHVSYSLTFLDTPLMLKNSLVAELVQFEPNSTIVKGTNNYNISIRLEDADLSSIPLIIKKYNLTAENYRFWIAFTSEIDNGVISIPDFVLKLYSEINGYIDISFIFIGDGGDERTETA